jgi:hypothetical protein
VRQIREVPHDVWLGQFWQGWRAFGDGVFR